MKISEMRALDDGTISQKLLSLRQELLRLNLRRRVSPVDKTHQFKRVRQMVAQLLTIQNERKRGEQS
ncbi:MAG: 50S ribosomal protein L29 [Puniceicoccales bacterium]|jgi:ribosomal protein L29|nr:50S ribosomal protein L29 [Puniceicoccales bacterium]